MIEKQKLERINELARKKKAEGLSTEELAEQQVLREEYLGNLRSSMRKSVEGIKIVDEDGNDVTPDKIKEIQTDQKLHGRHLEHFFKKEED